MRARILAALLLLGGASQSYAVCGYNSRFEATDGGYACAEKTDDGLLECFDDSGGIFSPTPPAYAVDGFSSDPIMLVWIKGSDDTLHYDLMYPELANSSCATYGLCDGGPRVGEWCIDGPDCPTANCDVGAAGGLCNASETPNAQSACTTNADCPRYWYSDWPTGVTFTDVAAVNAGAALCGIKTDGTIFCWGELVEDWGTGKCHVNSNEAVYAAGVTCTSNADCASPLGTGGTCYTGTAAPAGTFASIDGTYDVFCGIKTDGSLACWGDTRYYGESAGAVITSVPAGTNYTKVEVAGDGGACALKNDGTIACWGDSTLLTASPGGTFTDMGAALDFGCATTAAGAVQCWGDTYAWAPTTCGWSGVTGNESTMCYRTPNGYLACSYPYIEPTPSSCTDETTLECPTPTASGYINVCVGM